MFSTFIINQRENKHSIPPSHLPHRETIASPVRNKPMHTEEHLIGFKVTSALRTGKDAYSV
ncbi:hypothetical protein BSCG_01466 [Bacteroides sp. 2_2_4]|nr:hypothetical protein BSCG_01466 [Bacteroides sp. 2_2_4]